MMSLFTMSSLSLIPPPHPPPSSIPLLATPIPNAHVHAGMIRRCHIHVYPLVMFCQTETFLIRCQSLHEWTLQVYSGSWIAGLTVQYMWAITHQVIISTLIPIFMPCLPLIVPFSCFWGDFPLGGTVPVNHTRVSIAPLHYW